MRSAIDEFIYAEFLYGKRHPDIAPCFNDMDDMWKYIKLCRDINFQNNKEGVTDEDI